MANKLEFKINTDPKNKKVDITSMSLQDAQTFLVLIQSLTKIVANTPNNKDLKIQITTGSLVTSVEGEGVETIKEEYREVIANNSPNSDLVNSWRNIHKIFSQNGYDFEAEFQLKNDTISIFQPLKDANKIRTKAVHNPRIRTNIDFIHAKLIAVGGKSPNIHIEMENGERIIIACTEQNANKAKAYLYNYILISVWTTYSQNKKTLELCDSYNSHQVDIFNDFKSFIDELKSAKDVIDSLDKIHYKCKSYLDKQNYGVFRKFARLFIHEDTDVNILKTILIITRSFKEHPRLKETRAKLKEVFDKNMKGDK